ncbi:hypothetical protein KP509_07G011100 [Ceratopteris richardii]|uniref:Uncharacterized protein n=1 Tax=Ceratopteris richardii TaxID=49495 RepID=A0A8T2U7G0_CERRI|nr:hypothetical protein KP509_07G011100 [Ceratopteris richardii]
MATSAYLFLFFCIGALFFALASAQSKKPLADDAQMFGVQLTTGAPSPLNCKAACKYRCSESSHPSGCKRACGTCCIRCNCVPPGTSGNQQACGVCYARQKGPDGNPKCP